MKQPDILLTDQVAIVTGGGGGIGRAIALACASVGAHVAIGDIVAERCEETAARVREMGGQALAVPTDVTDSSQVRRLIEQADHHFGRIDILVNNAGGVSRKPFIEQSERSWRRLIDLNLVSMLANFRGRAPHDPWETRRLHHQCQ
jgi:NAD(P)-dependent dehydrogenase (short-subunit alcohol dehydrogenase family)